MLTIDLIEPVAEGIDNGFEVVDDFLRREPVPAAEEVGAEIARLDADDLDSQVLDLVPQALGYSHEGEFRGGVEPTSSLALPPADGAHVGDHAGLALTHVGENGAGDGELAEDVGVELRFGFLVTDYRNVILSRRKRGVQLELEAWSKKLSIEKTIRFRYFASSIAPSRIYPALLTKMSIEPNFLTA